MRPRSDCYARLAILIVAGAVGVAGRAVAAPSEGAAVRAAIERCLPRLDLQRDVGYARIASVCPELMLRLGRSSIAAALPADWQTPTNDLSANGLRELLALLDPTRLVGLKRPPLAVATLHGILRDTGVDAAGRDGWLRRLMQRIRSQAGSGVDDRDGSMLSRFADRVSASREIWTAVTYVLLAALAALVAWAVYGELRAAGLLTRPARERAQRFAVNALPRGAGLQLDAVDTAPLAERPGLLLQLAAEAAARGSPALTTGHMTARELAAALPVESMADQERLCRLASAAERVRYAACVPASIELREVIADGRVLVLKLQGAPA